MNQHDPTSSPVSNGRAAIGLVMIIVGSLLGALGLLFIVGYLFADEDDLLPLIIQLAILGAFAAGLIGGGFRLIHRP